MSIGLLPSFFRIRRSVLALFVLVIGVESGLAAGPKMKVAAQTLASGKGAKPHLVQQPCISCRRAKAPPDLTRRHFAEIEATLNESFSLRDLRLLPRAPGSEIKVLDGGKRARAQLPAVAVGDLIEKGIPLTVRRDFMLVRKPGKVMAADPVLSASRECSGPSVAGNSGTDYPIPENDWTYSDIAVSEAPANAEVTCIDVHYEIVHPRVSDLVVDLTNDDVSLVQRLWDRGEGSDGNLSQTVAGITYFAGQRANQVWKLWAQDKEYGQTGHIDDWWIKVYYLACPEDTLCSGSFAEGSNNADHWIPFQDWTHSDIAVSSAPEPAYVTCMDVHYEIKHDYVGDLVLDLANQDISREHSLRYRWGGSSVDVNETVTGITAFTNETVNQTWGLWAQDLEWGDDGYIDSWWIKVYYQSEPVTVEHDFCQDAVRVENGVPYSGTSVGATGDDETTCSRADQNDVWHVYTAPHTALATVTLACTNFDTTLAVFDQCGGRELVCSDDACHRTDSRVTMLMTSGTDYLIRVAGYQEQIGRYTLTVHQDPNVAPSEPNQPDPYDGAADVAVDVVLAWNGWTGPNEPATLAKSLPTQAKQEKIIYGSDDRVDEYAVTDPGLRAAGDATVVFVDWLDLTDNGDGTYSLPSETFAEWYEWVDPLGTGNALCPDEPFRRQPVPGWCSGVLVAPDLVATAGHCMVCETPSDIAVVFGFVMRDELTAATTVNAEEVYRCAEVVGHREGDSDWSLVRLERPVTNHVPLRMRRTGKVADDQPLLVVGNPYGLPRKYDAGGQVRDNTAVAYFQANLDTYDGSSGSPAINLDSMEVEGLLVDGNEDFAEDTEAGCDRSNWCPDTGCPDWESLTRVTLFSPLVGSFDVYLGTDPAQLQLVDADTVVPWLKVGPLQQATTYYWRILAKNAGDETAGPIWSFTTR